MSNINFCQFVGNLGFDPEKRSEKVTSLLLAVDDFRYDRENQKVEKKATNWVHVTGFNELASRILEQYKKGDRVLVQGRLKTSQYQDKEGKVRSGFEIIAQNILPIATQFDRTLRGHLDVLVESVQREGEE